jgi:hypothetical protein
VHLSSVGDVTAVLGVALQWRRSGGEGRTGLDSDGEDRSHRPDVTA